jgi:hypothetical protein
MNSYLTMYLAKARTDALLRQAKRAGAVGWRREGRRPSIAAAARRALTGARSSTSAREELLRTRTAHSGVRSTSCASEQALPMTHSTSARHPVNQHTH